jgi:protoporphyrinogen oxidase
MGGNVILGAGITGLGAALSSGAAAYEATERVGGVCHSYYIDESGRRCDPSRQSVADCFRFEPGGGHWLFGLSGAACQRMQQYARLTMYARRAAVFFSDNGRFAPYPLQDHIRCLDRSLQRRILDEIRAERCPGAAPANFRDSLLASFGPTLCELFFFPFNERYTAGLYHRVAPQDAYKSRADRERMLNGTRGAVDNVGYNCVFYYPEHGLDQMVAAIAAQCRICLQQPVQQIDLAAREIAFADGRTLSFDRIVSTIPLHRILAISGLECGNPDPFTAVLVVNIGARKGLACPQEHWVYLPNAKSGFHRVGFYSNVEPSFLPGRYRESNQFVSVYAEKSFPADSRPSVSQQQAAVAEIMAELVDWGFVREVLVADSTYTDPAYTWSWPNSRWPRNAISRLASYGVLQVGRYGAWHFQGMNESFEQGLKAGGELAGVISRG